LDNRRGKPAPLEIDLARLPKLTNAELRALWAEHFRGKPPPSRNLLIREIAWRTQEQRDGGFDAETRRLLKAAMRAATAAGPRSKPREDDVAADGSESRKRHRRKPTTSPKLPAAARLVREWGGVRHEVTVVEDGRAYRYRDRTFKSLTAVAREITGTHRSGPMFFGLSNRAGKRAANDNEHKPKGGRR
jgi:hypothetical protein